MLGNVWQAAQTSLYASALPTKLGIPPMPPTGDTAAVVCTTVSRTQGLGKDKSGARSHNCSRQSRHKRMYSLNGNACKSSPYLHHRTPHRQHSPLPVCYKVKPHKGSALDIFQAEGGVTRTCGCSFGVLVCKCKTAV